MVGTLRGDLATPEGISHVDPIKNAANKASRGRRWRTPRSGWGDGTAAVYKETRDGSKYDLMIAGISAASLILIITRSLVAMLPKEPEANTGRFAAASPHY